MTPGAETSGRTCPDFPTSGARKRFLFSIMYFGVVITLLSF